MPPQVARLSLERSFTADEFGLLARGLIPEAMEDKWFIWCCTLGFFDFYRSWTGFCIFEVALDTAEGVIVCA